MLGFAGGLLQGLIPNILPGGLGLLGGLFGGGKSIGTNTSIMGPEEDVLGIETPTDDSTRTRIVNGPAPREAPAAMENEGMLQDQLPGVVSSEPQTMPGIVPEGSTPLIQDVKNKGPAMDMNNLGLNDLSKLAEQAGITNPLEKQHFLAQLAHESGGFKHLRELGKKSYFNRYEGRKSLGNTSPGDGYKYRGRGYIQLTGKYNYNKFGKKLAIDLVNNPELAASPDVAMKIAAEYWRDRGIGKFARQNNIKEVTRRINGGYNGLRDRQRWFQKLGGI